MASTNQQLRRAETRMVPPCAGLTIQQETVNAIKMAKSRQKKRDDRACETARPNADAGSPGTWNPSAVD
jgi:hypothetical protein